MAEASAHKLSYVEEATRGVTPNAPRFQRLPDTRTTIALVKDTLQTERLTGTRFPAEPRTGARSVSGDIPADLSFNTYNAFIESAVQGPFLAQGTAPATTPSPDGAFTYGPREAGEDVDTITIAASANISTPITISLVNVGSTWATANGNLTVESIDADAGELVLVYNDGSTDVGTTFEVLDNNVIDGEDVTLDALVDAQRITQAKAGNTRKSFSILREFGDLEIGSKPFLLYKGCEVSTWSLNAAANSIARSTFTFFGRDMEDPATDAPVGTSYKDPIDSQPFDTFNGELQIDGQSECVVTDYTLNVNNGYAPRFAVGCPDSQDPMVGQSLVDGSITVYFENTELYEKFINEETMSLRLKLQDSIGNQLEIYLPRLRILTGTQPDVTADGSITMTINFSAHLDDNEETHLVVTSVEAP